MSVTSGSVSRSSSPLTPEQNRLMDIQLGQARQLLGDFSGQRDTLEGLLGGLREDFGGQLRDTFTDRQAGIDAETPGILQAGGEGLSALEGLGNLTSEEDTNIAASTRAAFAAGQGRINRGLQDELDVIGQEISTARGLRATDSPIRDLGNRAARRALDQTSDLSSQLATREQQQRLDIPRIRGQQQISSAANQLNLRSQAQSFQNQLRQSAFLGQAGLQSFGTSSRLGLIGASAIPFSNVGSPTVGGSSRTNTDLGGGLGAGIALGTGLKALFGGAAAGAAGATAAGAAGAGAAGATAAGAAGAGAGATGILSFLSSKGLKHHNNIIDKQKILESLNTLTVEKWQYKDSPDDHIGPYAEDFKEAFGMGDGRSIPVVDIIGVAMASIQALSKKVKDLEDKLEKANAS